MPKPTQTAAISQHNHVTMKVWFDEGPVHLTLLLSNGHICFFGPDMYVALGVIDNQLRTCYQRPVALLFWLLLRSRKGQRGQRPVVGPSLLDWIQTVSLNPIQQK